VLINWAAKRLPYSDHIVCFSPKGEISAQGTFADLNDDGGYVSSFSLPQADWTFASNGGGGDDDITDFDSDHNDMTTTLPKEMDSSVSVSSTGTRCTQDEDADMSRQTGDVQIYLYYIKSVGWLATLVFVFAIVGFVFSICFPSK
jgi:hypothetical protein